MFPVEIVENILKYCDGKTLLACSDVNETFRGRVRYLTENTNIWKDVCYAELPKNVLLEYMHKYFDVDEFDERTVWPRIYENWSMWQNIDTQVYMEHKMCPIEVMRVTCIAVSGMYICLGFECGRVRVFNFSWKPLSTHRFACGRINTIKFLTNSSPTDKRDILILISYVGGTLYITNAIASINQPFITYHDILTFSVYKNYLCCIRRGGRITIDQIEYPFRDDPPKTELTYVRVYSPNEVTKCNLWDGVCTFLLHNEVKILEFSENSSCPPVIKHKLNLKFGNNCLNGSKLNVVFRDDIIFTMTDNITLGEVLDFFLLGPQNTVIQKSFNVWECLAATITAMYLYGNTFVIGDNTGNVSFFDVTSWEKFDLKVSKQIYLGPHPVVSIDVAETKRGRIYYVASTSRIHRVDCHTTSLLQRYHS